MKPIITIIGNLTSDPAFKVKKTGGTPFVAFTVAVNDGYGDNKKTYYFNVYFTGEEASNRFQKAKVSKGSAIRVTGALAPIDRNYTRQDGTQDHKMELNINGMDWEYLPSAAKKENGTTATPAPAAPASAPAAAPAAPAARTAQQPAFASTPTEGNFTELGDDDDLPF